jgi:peroxin-2
MSSGSFAAAQQRVLERQAARQREAEAYRASLIAEAQQTPFARLPRPLNRAAPQLTSFWSTLVSSEGTKPAFRVGQVDAELLDEELLSLLRGQVGEGLKYFGAHLQDEWSQEILLALRAILFKLSLWDNNASYGASLQNLRYADARQPINLQSKPSTLQKSLYGIFTVLGRYTWDKWETYLVDQEGGYTTPSPLIQRLSRLTSLISTTHSIAAFASFLIFLINGRYRTLTDRLLRLRLVSPSNQISREVSFEYLNRQLVWHAFTEFLLFLLPLVGISRWRRFLSRAWKRTKSMMNSDSSPDEPTPKTGPLSFLPERTCAICYSDLNPSSTTETELLGANTSAIGITGNVQTDIVNPYQTPCGCIYCFVCLATKIEGEEGQGWTCLRCGETVYNCRPWSGDVVEPNSGKKEKGNGKSVGFSDDVGGSEKSVRSEEWDHTHQDQNEDREARDGLEASSHLDGSRWNVTNADDGP